MFCEAKPEWQGALELQFVGEAGSCMFWHAMLPHGASLNASARPRLATIARWRFPLPEVPPTIEMVSRARSACCCQVRLISGVSQREREGVDAEMRRHLRSKFGGEIFREWGSDVRASSASARL